MDGDHGAIIELARETMGLDLGVYDESHLRASVARRISELGQGSLADYLDRLRRDAAELDLLAGSLINSYSLFFRNALDFSLIESCVLPELLRRKRAAKGEALRIWSAGCAEGQEPYSLAILADQAMAEDRVPVMIFATDSSPEALLRAERGEFRPEALRNVRLSFLDGHFERSGSTYALGARPRGLVRFSAYDMLDRSSSSPPESIYGNFDLVACCNLLIYYAAAARKFILEKLRLSLADGGYLLVGESEKTLVDEAGGFRPFASFGHIFTKS